MACVSTQFPPCECPSVMRQSKVVPWHWILENGLSGDELRFYDTRALERMSNPGQGEADMWSGPEPSGVYVEEGVRLTFFDVHGDWRGDCGRYLQDVRR